MPMLHSEHHLEALRQREGRVHVGDDLAGEIGRVRRRGGRVLHDDVLVAAHARQRIEFAHDLRQPRRDRLQELVADGMAQRVVDLLEAVEIDAVHGEPLAGAQTRQRPLQALAHEHAVGQVRQPVVAREVLNRGLRLATLGDVLVRAHPSAARHRHVRGRDRAAVVHLLDRVARGVDRAGPILQIFLRRATAPDAERDAPLDDLAARVARLNVLGLQPIQGGVALVADDDALVLVVHAQALRHVQQGRVEQQVARLELLLALL